MTPASNRFESLGARQRTALLLAVVLLAAILLAALAEGGLRLRQYLKHGSSSGGIEELYRYDEALDLRVPVAGFETERVRINSLGFRGPEIPQPKPAGTLRVAFVGASTTFCASLDQEDVWAGKVIERLAAHYPDQRFDYVNAGVPGYVAESSARNLAFRVAPLAPDIVIIYHATNDLSSNGRAAAKRAGWQGAHGEQQLSWLSQYSVLVYLLEKNLKVWTAQRRASDLARADAAKIEVPPAALAEPFEADLRALVAEAQAVADQVVLVTFSPRVRQEQSTEVRAEAAVTSLYYMPFMSLQGLIDGFAAYNEVIRKVGRDADVLVIGGEHEIPGTGEYYVDSVHFTARGGARMAARVADGLIGSGALDDALAKAAP